MAITGAAVISKARFQLSDLTATYRWADAELVGWLNSGQREIILVKPNSFAQPVVQQLVPGTVQTITGLQFIRVNRNMWDPITPGSAVQDISQELIDVYYPGWHVATPSLVTKFYMFDKRDSVTFLVYPPQPNPAGYAQVVQTPYPTDITIDVSNVIQGVILDDIFEGALIDYVISRALGDDTAQADMVLSDKYFQRFFNAVGGKAQAENIAKADTDAR